MRDYPIPFNEEARLEALENVPGLCKDNEALFDDLCDATRKLLGCPIAHVSVVEESHQWFKSVIGVELDELPKSHSFCTHTIMTDSEMVVPDLSADPRFERHPMVAEGGPKARFYAGVPLVLSSGFRFGSLCALDYVAHEPPSEMQLEVLRALGRAVVSALEKAPAAPSAPAARQAGPENFVTLVGHELRTPLTVILGGLKLLEFRLKDPIERELTASSRRASEHLAQLIESILVFSDASTGELSLNAQPTMLSDILRGAVDTHGLSAEGRTRTLSVHDGSAGHAVNADPEHLHMALTALMLNSLCHGAGDISVGAQLNAAGALEITVRDEGTIDDHVALSQLYEPFVTGGDIDTRGTGGGLGLGLPLTRKLIELHGGEFEVIAEPTHTTALIRLPHWRVAPEALKAQAFATV